MALLFNCDFNVDGYTPYNAGGTDMNLAGNGIVKSGVDVTNTGIPGVIDLVSNPYGSGQVSRQIVRSTHATTFGSQRTEISLNKDAVGTERWYADRKSVV